MSMYYIILASSSSPLPSLHYHQHVISSLTSKRHAKPLRKAVILSEFIEELEVRCKYGVKAAHQHAVSLRFGVVGNDFDEIPNGCKEVFALKGML